jgi:hypothetical protein
MVRLAQRWEPPGVQTLVVAAAAEATMDLPLHPLLAVPA